MVNTLLKDSKIFLTLIILSILIFALDNLKLLNSSKAFLQNITIPLQYGTYKTGQNLYKQFEVVILSRRAAQENKALTEQIAQILSENANLRRKLAEAEGFLAQEKALNPQTFKTLGARPIGVSRFLRIDKGSIDNLKEGQVVVYKDNFIGLLKTVSPSTSETILAADPNSKIAAFVSNKNGKARGVLAGEFGSEMLLDKILHQEPIEKGDLVYTEGTELNLPKGLVIGQVVEILERPNEVFKQAKVKPLFDITNLEVVFVIIN